MSNDKTILEKIEDIQIALNPLGYKIFGFKEKGHPTHLVLHLEPYKTYVNISTLSEKPEKN